MKNITRGITCYNYNLGLFLENAERVEKEEEQ